MHRVLDRVDPHLSGLRHRRVDMNTSISGWHLSRRLFVSVASCESLDKGLIDSAHDDESVKEERRVSLNEFSRTVNRVCYRFTDAGGKYFSQFATAFGVRE